MCGNPGQEIGLDAATVNIYFCPQVILRPLKGNTGLEGWWRGDWIAPFGPVENTWKFKYIPEPITWKNESIIVKTISEDYAMQ